MSFLQRRKSSLPQTKTNNTCGLLWSKQGKNGNNYMSGMLLVNEEFFKRLESAEVDSKGNKKIYINVWDNTEDKQSENSPDFRICLRRLDD